MRSIRFALLLLAAVPMMADIPLPRPSVPPAPAAAAVAFEPGTDDALRSWESGNYTYDGAGNITAIGPLSYTYDGWLRLATSAKTGSSSQTFSYDPYGNLKRIATAGALTRLPAVNAATNRLDGQCPSEPNSVCLSGTYDEAGNQTGADGAFLYEFDELNMMRRLSGTARNEVYIYTADDERVATVRLFGGTPDWQYTLRGADAKVLREFRTAPSGIEWKQDWIHAGGRQLASLRAVPGAPPAARHFHLDHLGSTRLITDATARRLAELRFEAFGEEAPDSQPFDERLKFTGHERDDAGPGDVRDLDYMHARFYSPLTGRFLGVDPAGVDPARPMSWNAYAYVRNNPIGNVDPDGRNPLEARRREFARKHMQEKYGEGNPAVQSRLHTRREARNHFANAVDALLGTVSSFSGTFTFKGIVKAQIEVDTTTASNDAKVKVKVTPGVPGIVQFPGVSVTTSREDLLTLSNAEVKQTPTSIKSSPAESAKDVAEAVLTAVPEVKWSETSNGAGRKFLREMYEVLRTYVTADPNKGAPPEQ